VAFGVSIAACFSNFKDLPQTNYYKSKDAAIHRSLRLRSNCRCYSLSSFLGADLDRSIQPDYNHIPQEVVQHSSVALRFHDKTGLV
jgi:hypothetical protein